MKRQRALDSHFDNELGTSSKAYLTLDPSNKANTAHEASKGSSSLCGFRSVMLATLAGSAAAGLFVSRAAFAEAGQELSVEETASLHTEALQSVMAKHIADAQNRSMQFLDRPPATYEHPVEPQEERSKVFAPKVRRPGIFANVQVGHLPLSKYWQDREDKPNKFILEVGANSRNILRDEYLPTAGDRTFLITFEPLLDKYAWMLTGTKGKVAATPQLGLQHERGIVLPFAVGCEGNSATFHVSTVDGCSSLLKHRGEEFANDPKKKQWQFWWHIQESCAKTIAERTVPCISLEHVIEQWLGGAYIKHLKVDAQGFDLQVVKSAGRMLSRINTVHMEVQCDKAAMIYAGQPNCSTTYNEMRKLGFRTWFNPKTCLECAETDIDFFRPKRPIKPSNNTATTTTTTSTTTTIVAKNGIYATLQVSLAFSHYWAQVGSKPQKYVLEVGTATQAPLRDRYLSHAGQGTFLITFEPFLDKYAWLLTRAGGKPDIRSELGLQHTNGIVVPFAVGCEGSVTWRVPVSLGESALRKPSKKEMKADPLKKPWWVWQIGENTTKVLESRTIPCISLEQVISQWLEGQPVWFLKIDVLGSALPVVKSAGRKMDKLKSVRIQVQCDHAANLNLAQANCTNTIQEMKRLGFNSKFDEKACMECDRVGIDFFRPESAKKR